MKKNPAKAPLLTKVINSKKEEQKQNPATESFSQFMPKKPRHLNYSNVGPSWGGRKGN